MLLVLKPIALMRTPQGIATILVAATLCTTSQAFANSDRFYAALAKTEKQQFTAASQELEKLGQQYLQKGDRLNAYRSQATAALIRYERDSLAEYKQKGKYSTTPNWVGFGSCWASARKTDNNDSCAFGVNWTTPPTKIKNYGGLITLDKHLGYFPPNPAQGQAAASIRGIVDAVVVPKLNNSENITSSCKVIAGINEGEGALALVTYDNKLNKYTKIRQAWYTDFQARRILTIDPTLVSCPDPEVP
jgi:hypothetical protein